MATLLEKMFVNLCHGTNGDFAKLVDQMRLKAIQ